MFKFKATSGLPALSDNWIVDPAVRTVRVYHDGEDGGIVLQMYGNRRYLRATMTAEDAKALALRLNEVADEEREDEVQRLFLIDKLIGFHTAVAMLEKLGHSGPEAKRIVGEWWESTEEAMRESDFDE